MVITKKTAEIAFKNFIAHSLKTVDKTDDAIYVSCFLSAKTLPAKIILYFLKKQKEIEKVKKYDAR